MDEHHFDGTCLRDSSERVVVLHGYTVIPRLYLYGGGDYQRLLDHNVTVQCIEVEPARVAEPEYLDRLDAMILLGKRSGIYSLLRMSPSDRSNPWWDSLWAGRADLLKPWDALWQRYAQQTAVVGYDLLDMPMPGSATFANRDAADQFLVEHLTPFYRAAVDQARKANPNKLLVFQPLYIANFGDYPYLDGDLQRPKLLFGGHFHPHLKAARAFSYPVDTGYAHDVLDLIRNAGFHRAGLWVNFGLPWNGRQLDRKKDAQAAYRSAAESWDAEMDSRMLSGTRPAWGDDRVPDHWGVIMDKVGLQEEERPWMTNPEARPYPLRIAGDRPAFRWDAHTRTLTVTYKATKEGTTVLAVARRRVYPEGFVLRDQSGQVTRYDPNGTDNMTITATLNRVPNTVRYDEESQRLEVSGFRPDTGVRLTLAPR